MSTISSSVTITSSNFTSSYTWPVTINGGTSASPVTVSLGAGISITTTSQYFIIGSSYVIIDGGSNTFPVTNVTNYPGFVNNSSGSSSTISSNTFGVTVGSTLSPTSSNGTSWGTVMVSATGQYMWAGYPGAIWRSSDYGATWSNRSSSYLGNNSSISYDGKYVLLGGTTSYLSTDYGANFTATGKNFWGGAVSRNGQYMTGTGNGTQVLSSNYGATWATFASGYTLGGKCALSYTGQYILAQGTNQALVSSNYGVSFTAISMSNLQLPAMNYSGQYMVYPTNSGIYVSSDYGVTFALKQSSGSYFSSAVDSTGQYMAVGTQTLSTMYVSTNYGQSFYASGAASSSGNWYSMAMSDDAHYILGCIYGTNRPIFSSITTFTTSTNFGYGNVTLQNFTLTNSNSTLASGNGWVGQSNFGNTATSSQTITNVTSPAPLFSPITTSFTLTSSTFANYTWPLTISGGTSGSPVTVTLGSGISITSASQYFIIGSSYVTINGASNTVTISGVTSYPGLVQNGTSSTTSSTAYSSVTVQNIVISNSGSTLASNAGWIGQQYFGQGIYPTLTSCSGTSPLFPTASTISANSTLNSSWVTNAASWPITISGGATVTLGSNVTLTSTSQYFIIGSNSVTFNGASYTVTISGVTSYPGLIQDGTSSTTSANAYTGITVQNINIAASGSTQSTYAGWIGQLYFGTGVYPTVSNNALTSGTGNLFSVINSVSSNITIGSTAMISTWPLVISGATSASPITVSIGANLSISSATQYLQITSPYVTIDGGLNTVTVGNVINYPGLVQNGSSTSRGSGNVTVQNINITSTGSTLAAYNGWIGQQYFGKTAANVLLQNCTSYGTIDNSYCGAIVGAYAGSYSGNVTLYQCTSAGNIFSNYSGIFFGPYSGLMGGKTTMNNCTVTATVYPTDVNSGGIFALTPTTSTSSTYNYNGLTTNLSSVTTAQQVAGRNKGSPYYNVTNYYSEIQIANSTAFSWTDALDLSGTSSYIYYTTGTTTAGPGTTTVGTSYTLATPTSGTPLITTSNYVWGSNGMGMSSTGQYICVSSFDTTSGTNGGVLFYSANYGVTWAQSTGLPTTNFLPRGLSMSSDGQKVFVVNTSGATNEPTYYSTNGGASFVQKTNLPTTYYMNSSAISDDGQIIVVVCPLQSVAYISTNAATSWTSSSYGTGQNAMGVCMNSSGSTIYVGGGNGTPYSLWRSVNTGSTWTNIAGSYGLPSGIRWINCLAMTRDGTKIIVGAYGGSVYLSIDSGASFNAVSGPPTANWTNAAISPDGVYITVAADSGNLYLSTNSGASFSAQTTTIPTNFSYWQTSSMAITGNVFVACIGGYATSVRGNVYISYGQTSVTTTTLVNTTTTGSLNWLKPTSAPTTVLSNSTYSFYNMIINTKKSLCTSANGQYMYIAGSNEITNTGLNYIWSSSNSGTNWAANTSSTAFYSGSTPTASWKVINCDQSGQYVVSAATMSGSSVVYNSTNYGNYWAASTGHNTSGNASAICSSLTGNIVYLAYNTGQIYYSNNYGSSFSVLSGSTSLAYTDLACDSTGVYVYAASTDSSTGGVYYSANSGTTWTRVYTGQCLSVACINTSNGSTAFTGNYGANSLLKTTNSGSSWQTVSASPVGTAGKHYGYISCNQLATVIYISPSWQNNLVYQSTDSGTTFQTFIPVAGGYSFPYTFTSPYGTSNLALSSGTIGGTTSSVVAMTAVVSATPPTGITFVSATSSSVTISFTAASGSISGYTAIVNGSATAYTGSGTTSSYTISGLSANTSYSIAISSTTSSGYTSYPSSTLTILTRPSAPANLTLVSATSSSVTISFTAPSGTGTISSYTPSTGTGSGTASSYTISGLSSNTTYSISLTATNSSGASSSSSTVSVTTAPSAPTTLTYVSATTSSVTISFTAPSGTGTISSYTPSTGTGSGTSTAYTISGLSTNTSYSISLTATNASGTSSSSSAVSVLTQPTAPTGLTYVSATSSSITISFTAPTGTGTITGYTPSTGSGSGTTSSYVISGLSSSTAYTISLTATNASGTSASSSTVSGTTTASYTVTGTYTTSTVGAYTLISFTSGSGTINFGSAKSAPTLIVAGGGGGGSGLWQNLDGGGGGGGGGVGAGTLNFAANTTYNITVGAGGGYGTWLAGQNPYSTGYRYGSNGGDSSISGGSISETAYGGGGGANLAKGAAGGSGGGASGMFGDTPANSQSGSATKGSGSLTYYGNTTPGQGNQNQSGLGGGGAGGTGGAQTTIAGRGYSALPVGGYGGPGYTWSINNTTYGGGGGGGATAFGSVTTNPAPGGTGGSGGGGNGGAAAAGSAATMNNGSNGADNTGGGGGGDGGGYIRNMSATVWTPYVYGGNGGSGIVIIAFQ